jgi:hypothetical protein
MQWRSAQAQTSCHHGRGRTLWLSPILAIEFFQRSGFVYHRYTAALLTRLSRLLQKLRAQHQALDLVGAAFDLVLIVGEVDDGLR